MITRFRERLELGPPADAGQHPDPPADPGRLGHGHVGDRVTDHRRPARLDPDAPAGGQDRVRSGLRWKPVVRTHDRIDELGDPEAGQGGLGRGAVIRGHDRDPAAG